MSEKIVVLGAGISGLLSAWALEKLGCSFLIYEKQSIETLLRPRRGCMYLHDLCNLPSDKIHLQHCLTSILPTNRIAAYSRLYHKKIWGNIPYIKNSVERFEGIASAEESIIYSMDDAIKFLVNHYHKKIIQRDLTQNEIFDLEKTNQIVSTIPFPLLDPLAKCEYETLYISHSNTELSSSPTYEKLFAFVWYNIDPETSWYRMSHAFGQLSIEYMKKSDMAFQPLYENKKIKTCKTTNHFMKQHPNIFLTGRWGLWDRTRLSHHTYYEVLTKFK